MERNTGNQIDFNALGSGIRKIADLSVNALKNAMTSQQKMMSDFSDAFQQIGIPMQGFQTKKSDCGCCPPKEDCPPHCLMNLSRTAYAGERITVPFRIKNKSSTAKHYRLGIRPLMDDSGGQAPSQPQLDKTTADLQPYQSEMFNLSLDLAQFPAGHNFSAEIVVREKDINQNICFTLHVRGYDDVPEAWPYDEKKYGSHFQSWQSHFYCDPAPTRRDQLTVTKPND